MRYIAVERGQIPVDVSPVKRPEMTGRRQVMRMVEAGEVFEFDGKPGRWMQPYDGPEPDQGNARGRRGSRKSSATAPESSQTATEQDAPHANSSP